MGTSATARPRVFTVAQWVAGGDDLHGGNEFLLRAIEEDLAEGDSGKGLALKDSGVSNHKMAPGGRII